MGVLEALTEEECYLWSILSDETGLDQAEFLWHDPSSPETQECFRAWPFQWRWWRCGDKQQIDQCARAVGKSRSLSLKAFSFPFLFPNQEMLITAPELNHLEAITGVIEEQIFATRLSREMLLKGRGGSAGVTHRPFAIKFQNQARLLGRIPQRDGKGVKGCLTGDALVLTTRGAVPASELEAGDEVWTHEQRWRPVLEVQTFEASTYEVRGQGAWPVRVTDHHRFLARENATAPGHHRRRELQNEGWYDPVDLSEDWFYYWATPHFFPQGEAVSVPKPVGLPLTEEFWWLVGRYVADGCVSGKNAIAIFPNPAEVERIGKYCTDYGLTHSVSYRRDNGAPRVQINSRALRDWCKEHLGTRAENKSLPTGLIFQPQHMKDAFLDGYLNGGDGHWEEAGKRWICSSTSKRLMLMVKLVAQSAGFVGYCTGVQSKTTHIKGVPLKSEPKYVWRVQLKEGGNQIAAEGNYWMRVHRSEPTDEIETVYNPIVEEDHSFLADGVFHHNTHPIRLEMDEASDYPEAGWNELVETLKSGFEGAMWRAHGVTRGVRDKFYEFTQPGSNWTVHRLTGMHRPNWSDAERQEKIELYGSKDSPDYRRNILGLHGDSTNPIFILSRFMRCVDSDETSDYNAEEYYYLRLTGEQLEDREVGDIRSMVKPPESHLDGTYNNFWIGMDVGFTNHPSEILVFGEYRPKKGEKSVMKLVTRIHMRRIRNLDQVRVMIQLIMHYKPKAFALDRTGVGLPLYQDIQDIVAQDERLRWILDLMRGYVFNSKILVDFDHSVELDEFRGDPIKDAGIQRSVMEYATDRLRMLVDAGRLVLPWDRSLLRDMQGQTETVIHMGTDAYGRRRYSAGDFHCLDAARMAVLAWAQHAIEEMQKAEKGAPVLDTFIPDVAPSSIGAPVESGGADWGAPVFDSFF